MLNAKLMKDPLIRQTLLKRDPSLNWDLFDEINQKRKDLQIQTEQLQATKNALAKKVSHSNESEKEDTIKEGGRVRTQIQQNQEALDHLMKQEEDFLMRLPNLPDPSVPQGTDESANVVVFQSEEPSVEYDSVDHVDIGKTFGLDQESSAQLSGTRFAVMKGPLARLHRALVQMMLDTHTNNGYEEVYVPYLVKEDALKGTGQLPKFEDDLFKTKTHYLIPTAEVPLTNLVANQATTMDSLPLKMVAHTPCFRQEAGAAGRDTKGLIRQHQFEKVELVQVVHPNESPAAHQDMLTAASSILEKLELPFRVVELCVGDLGFAAQKTYDIEVWLPSQKTFREISSVSNCGDFQARRMKAKYKGANEKGFLHTLNGSGVAVGRALVAVLENHITPEGRLYLPLALRPYMGNMEYLIPSQTISVTKKNKP